MPNDFPLDVELLRDVLDYLNVGVYITDLDRRIILWNRKAVEITGHRAAEVVGKACHENVLNHIDKDGRTLCKSGLCPLYRAMRTGQESTSPVLVYARQSNGARVAVSVSVAPLRDSSGAVIGGIEVFRDETASLRDLEFAKTVQRHLMPQSIPQAGALRCDVRYYPHDILGGDFYDVRPLGPNRFGVLVADVRGHGVSAALYTVWLKSLEDNLTDVADDPGAFLSGMNRQLSGAIVEESFATAFYAVVDGEFGRIAYGNAGHPAPLHYHARSVAATEIEGGGLPLGISADEVYATARLSLDEGDLLLCYTDGVTEVAGRDGRLLGAQGLADILRKEIAGSKRALLDRIYNAVVEASGAVSLADDVLLLSIARPAR